MVTQHHRRDAAFRGASDPMAGLPRRLLVTCPETGLLTATGFDLWNRPSGSAARQVLIDCLECGQDHAWRMDEATWEPSHNPSSGTITREESHAIRN